MKESDLEALKRLFHEMIMLYGDLRLCFIKERASLIRVDLDELWPISGEKERICSQIESVGKKMMDETGGEGPIFSVERLFQGLPAEKRAGFDEMHLVLLRLKEEIEGLRKENVSLVQDGIQMLDDMISILAGESTGKITYDGHCRMNRPVNHLMLRREV